MGNSRLIRWGSWDFVKTELDSFDKQNLSFVYDFSLCMVLCAICTTLMVLSDLKA